MFSLNQFIFILDTTTHPGNLGSVARIVKNMGITNVRLVTPKADPLDPVAIAMSANATDVLETFTIHPSIEQAIEDCDLVLATSARKRGYNPIIITADQILATCSQALGPQMEQLEQLESLDLVPQDQQPKLPKIAVLFGTENSGLPNHAMQLANYHVVIDCNPDYTSLNLSMACLVLAYEIRKQVVAQTKQFYQSLQQVLPESLGQIGPDQYQHYEEDQLASSGEIQFFLQRLESHLESIGFTQHPGTMQRLRVVALRAMLHKKELNVLQGIIT